MHIEQYPHIAIASAWILCHRFYAVLHLSVACKPIKPTCDAQDAALKESDVLELDNVKGIANSHIDHMPF